MKRLDQDHLHSKLEVRGLTCSSWEWNPASKLGGEHYRKEPFKQLINSYLKHLHMNVRPVENDARDHPDFDPNLGLQVTERLVRKN
jgi:hypothetical protein